VQRRLIDAHRQACFTNALANLPLRSRRLVIAAPAIAMIASTFFLPRKVRDGSIEGSPSF
jgi:hypothetical protein